MSLYWIFAVDKLLASVTITIDSVIETWKAYLLSVARHLGKNKWVRVIQELIIYAVRKYSVSFCSAWWRPWQKLKAREQIIQPFPLPFSTFISGLVPKAHIRTTRVYCKELNHHSPKPWRNSRRPNPILIKDGKRGWTFKIQLAKVNKSRYR